MNIKQRIQLLAEFPNRVYNFLILKYRHVTWGKDLTIHGRIYCVSNSNDGIRIGDHVRINSSRHSNPIGGDTKTILFAKGNGKIRIGDGCGISCASIIACDSITLGNQVFVGGGTRIYDTDFHWLDFDKRISELGGATAPVTIGDGAFIGAHCIILKGVTIGEKSIVGAGSVVTKTIPAGEVWAGNPAKYIRKL